MQNLLDDLIKTLSSNKNFIVDGKLLKNIVIERALAVDADLLHTLAKSPAIKKHFFTQIDGFWVFDKIKFQDFVSNKEFLPDSYTAFKNAIGLSDEKNSGIKRNRDVILTWAYKDCVLEGGQEKESDKRNEIFYNQTLAPDEITRLFSSKVLTKFEKWDSEAVKNNKFKEVKEIKETDNLIIKGNNLLVLHTLRKRFFEKIKLIYIDPPYNTGNDGFNYNDSFNHSTWLTFMKNRLEVARDLLKKDGVIFIQCDDNEQAYLKVMTDEIFGRENFVGDIIWLKKNAQNDAIGLQKNSEHILCYKKSDLGLYEVRQKRQIEVIYEDGKYYYESSAITTGGAGGVLKARLNLGYTVYYHPKTKDFLAIDDVDKEKAKTSDDENIVYKDDKNLISKGYIAIRPPKKGAGLGRWTWALDYFNDNKDRILIKTSNKEKGYRIVKREWVLEKEVLKDDNGNTYVIKETEGPPKNIIDDVSSSLGTKELLALFNSKLFANPKSEKLLQKIVEISTKEGDIVCDFFAGSGTTLAVAHKMHRQYIGIEQLDYIKDLPEARLKKVIAGEQGGVSQAVGWKGGGEFIYLELAKLNEVFIEKIRKSEDIKTLLLIYAEMKKTAFMRYEIENFDKDEFQKLDFAVAQKVLADCLDKNHLYVNYSEIEDIRYKISEDDIEINRGFYK